MSEEPDILKTMRKAHDDLAEALETFGQATAEIETKRLEIKNQMKKRIEQFQLTRFNFNELDAFVRQPYIVIPKPSSGQSLLKEWWVIVPKCFDFHLGWLDFSTPSYNVFTINKYLPMFGYDVPEQLKDRFDVHTLPVKVSDGLLLVEDPARMDEIWDRYRTKGLVKRKPDSNAFYIQQGSEYDLIAEIVADGTLPFIPHPVDQQDLQISTMMIDGKLFELRDYQEVAWQTYIKHGAIGVFYPFGVGKSLFGEYVLSRMKGKKLVIVPTLTLKEQWQERMTKHGVKFVEIETYHVANTEKFKDMQKTEYSLVVFDECQHLPANTFIKLSTLHTKYRLGLSGSPYREDGRVNLIIALTGFPLGMSWEKFFELGIIRRPNVTLRLVKTPREKLILLDAMLGMDIGKTIIFCDSLDLGRNIAKKYNIKFVYGESMNRIETVQSNEIVVVSRVGDEGLSIPDIDTVIEVDFLYGSRMQESQRAGRLLHSQKEATNHYVLMTEEEFEKYGKRLNALYERGFNIEIVR